MRYIRKNHRPYINTRQLAEKFNVAKQTITAISHGEIWGWLDQEKTDGPH